MVSSVLPTRLCVPNSATKSINSSSVSWTPTAASHLANSAEVSLGTVFAGSACTRGGRRAPRKLALFNLRSFSKTLSACGCSSRGVCAHRAALAAGLRHSPPSPLTDLGEASWFALRQPRSINRRNPSNVSPLVAGEAAPSSVSDFRTGVPCTISTNSAKSVLSSESDRLAAIPHTFDPAVCFKFFPRCAPKPAFLAADSNCWNVKRSTGAVPWRVELGRLEPERCFVKSTQSRDQSCPC